MTHEEIQILISAYIDGELTPSQKDIVEEHLSSCASCQKDYKAYRSISSSLSKWTDENLSPDEEIKLQKRIEQRREPMFTKRTATIFATTLALTIIVGSVVQVEMKHGLQAGIRNSHVFLGVQGRLRSAADDLRDQYSDKEKKRINYEPYYMVSVDQGATREIAQNKRLAAGLLGKDEGFGRARSGSESTLYASNYPSTVVSGQAVGGSSGNSETDYYKNPSTSDYYSTIEEDRKKIQQAEINLLVDNAFKTKSVLTDLIVQSNGIIMNSEFNRSPDGAGSGTMVCKVYPKDLEHTLQEIRKLGEVQNENESSVDVTDRYGDIQKNISKFTSDKDRLQKTLNTTRLFNPSTDEEKENAKRQIEQIKEAIDSLDNMIKSLQQQTEMSIIVVNFYDKAQNTVKDNDSNNVWKSMFENKWKSVSLMSLEVFTNILFGIIFLLSYIVPVLVWVGIFAAIYWIISLFFKK